MHSVVLNDEPRKSGNGPDAPRGDSRSALRTVLLVLGVAAAYFAAARLGLALAFVEQKVTLVWPPTGVALAALLIFGCRALPGVRSEDVV